MATAEILSQGDEVVTGQTVDTNAAWLAERLTELGVVVIGHRSVPDDLHAIASAFQDTAGRVQLCLCTGGLGPTTDDLTAQALATAFSRPLELRQDALEQVEQRFRAFGRPMPAINRKQALLPAGSLLLKNRWGTAPAFAVQERGTWFVCLPGVPHEMRSLFHEHVISLLSAQLRLQPGRLVTLRTTGLGESALQERLGDFTPAPAVLGYRALIAEVQLKLRFPPSCPGDVLERIVADAAQRVGTPVFAIQGAGTGLQGDLAQVVGAMLAQRGHTIATAESCTGGRLAAAFTGVPGSSAWFQQGVITYSNASKQALLGVPELLLAEHGAVSAPVAIAMAAGARERAGTTWALATTGIAGPDGGTSDKPVGLVHLAVAGPGGVHHRELRYGGARDRVQALASAGALDLLRRTLIA